MSVNNMLVGRSFSFAWYDPSQNNTINMGDVVGVRVRRLSTRIESRPYNGLPRFGYIPMGYEIDFDMIRVDPDIEDWQLAYDTVFNSGGDVLGGYLNETITYTGGVVRAFQYTNFVFSLDDISDVAREKNVTSRGKGSASDKVAIS